MKKSLIRRAREPKARFVGTALFAQLATFVLAFYLTEVMNHLLNPASMTIVMLGAGYTAATGRRIQKKPGHISKVAPLTVVIPLAPVVAGLPIAVAIQGTEFTPMIRSLLFSPWWLTFISVFLVFIYLAREENRKDSTPRPLCLMLSGVLGVIWGVSLFTFVTVVMVGTSL